MDVETTILQCCVVDWIKKIYRELINVIIKSVVVC
jgi:hypothetical protein